MADTSKGTVEDRVERARADAVKDGYRPETVGGLGFLLDAGWLACYGCGADPTILGLPKTSPDKRYSSKLVAFCDACSDGMVVKEFYWRCTLPSRD